MMTKISEPVQIMREEAQEEAERLGGVDLGGLSFECVECRQTLPDRDYDRKKNGERRLRCRNCTVELADKNEKRKRPAIHRVVEANPVVLPKNPQQRLTLAMQARMDLYQVSALDALYDIAMMPISGNSGQNQIKYLACCKLLGNNGVPTQLKEGDSDTSKVLAELNVAFWKGAKRIKRMREVEFEDGDVEALPPPVNE